MDTYCEWEWVSHEEGIVLIGCDMTEDGKDLDMTPGRNDTKAATNIKNGVETEKDGVAIGKKGVIANRKNARDGMIVERVGDYEKFECGLRFKVRAEHKGMWVCEMERYHWGFGRRYGEVRTKAMALVVTGKRKFRPTQQSLVSTFEPDESGSVTAHSSSSSSTPSSIMSTPPSSTAALCYKMSRAGDCLAETEAQFKRNFLILQIVVRVAVTVTLLLLAAVFGLLFLRNWRNWEKQINRNLATSPRHTKDDEDVEEEHPMLTVALGETRRKSVSFSVCVMGEDFKAFDLERKKVLVGPGGGGTPQQSACNLPTLYEQEQPEKTALQVPLVMKRKVSTRHPRPYTSCTQEEEDEKFGCLEVPRHEDRRNSMPPVPSHPQVKLDSLSHSIETVI